jgi:hypothetical protein
MNMQVCTLPGKNPVMASGLIPHEDDEEDLRRALEVMFSGIVRPRNTGYDYVMTCTKVPSMGAKHAWRLFQLADPVAISSEEVEEIHERFHIFLCRKSGSAGILTKDYKPILAKIKEKLSNPPGQGGSE